MPFSYTYVSPSASASTGMRAGIAVRAGLAGACAPAPPAQSGLDGAVTIAVRPEKITISREPPASGERNVVKGIVRDLGYFGDQSLYRVRAKSGAIIQVSAQNLRRSAKLTVEWDDEVFLSWEVGSTILLRS